MNAIQRWPAGVDCVRGSKPHNHVIPMPRDMHKTTHRLWSGRHGGWSDHLPGVGAGLL